MRKIFTFLCAALMSVGMWAEPITVTWNSYDMPSSGSGKSFTKDGVTITCGGIEWEDLDFYNGGTFTTDLGNFTKIEVYAGMVTSPLGEGWSGNSERQTWTGNASSVSFSGEFMSAGEEVNLTFTIEPASTPEPEPAEVTVVFAANNKTVERTVTLPHTFKCDWNNGMEGPDELDIIIHELYNDYYFCNNNIQASGSDQVEAGTGEHDNDYITIKGVFEGTATVTGSYATLESDAGLFYTLTISIKGDEPAPQGVGPREELNLGTDYPAGEHYQVLGEFSGPSWIGVGDINNETITVESLNGEIIDNITLEVYMPLHWTGYSIVATSGEVSGDVASYQDLVITNINATSVTLSRVGEGENGDSVLFSKIIVNEGSATAIEKTAVDTKAVKRIVNGQLLIERDGKLYNATGAEVK